MKTLLVITALLGALGVGLGAFGAHGLENKISEAQISIWNTAVKYQMIHVVVLLVLLLNSDYTFKLPAVLFIVGIVLFSGSLYLLSVKDLLHLGDFAKILVRITPIGGLSFIAGWILLAVRFLKL